MYIVLERVEIGNSITMCMLQHLINGTVVFWFSALHIGKMNAERLA